MENTIEHVVLKLDTYEKMKKELEAEKWAATQTGEDSKIKSKIIEAITNHFKDYHRISVNYVVENGKVRVSTLNNVLQP